jgi:hypothetical protein
LIGELLVAAAVCSVLTKETKMDLDLNQILDGIDFYGSTLSRASNYPARSQMERKKMDRSRQLNGRKPLKRGLRSKR